MIKLDACRDGEMVDALALGASGETHGGSSPLLGTIDYSKCPKKVETPFAQEPSEGGVYVFMTSPGSLLCSPLRKILVN